MENNPHNLNRPLLVDAHEDLAWNILFLGRDYTRSAAETRLSEAGSEIPAQMGDTLLGWPDYQRGRVAVVFSTLFASPRRLAKGDWDPALCYATLDEAYKLYQSQLDAYHRLTDEHPDQFRLLQTRSDLDGILAKWQAHAKPGWDGEDTGNLGILGSEAAQNTQIPDSYPPSRPVSGGEKGVTQQSSVRGEERSNHPVSPVGLCVLMEGAEGVRAPGELEEWWARGVRLIGLAWASNRYCGGTGEPGPLTSEGYALLEAMADLGFGLDLSHMDAESALQALDAYPGTILASHANAARLLKGMETNRHLPDEVIRGLIERDGVIGVVPYNHFLLPGWSKSDPRETVSLQHVVAQIDTLCQMAGNARHVGIGTDFDGGFGLQSVPPELDTIADLHKLAPLLSEKGYSEADIAAIFGQNWIDRLNRILH
jgi:membrane dipeptidase